MKEKYICHAVMKSWFDTQEDIYHAEGDVPETCDIKNAAMTVQATLAAVATIDSDI